MRKKMIANTMIMALITLLFAAALLLYLRSATTVPVGEAVTATYTASAKGYGSDVTVTAGYNGDKLISLTADASGETPAVGGVAAEKVTAAILATGSAEGVDAMASATLTSNAVLNAFADCEVQAGRLSAEEPEAEEPDQESEADKDEPATPAATPEPTPAFKAPEGADVYTASAKGYASDVTVTVYIKDGTLAALQIDAAGETAAVGGKIAAQMQADILAAGNADGVDAVAGATMTSEAVLKAFADCMAQVG